MNTAKGNSRNPWTHSTPDLPALRLRWLEILDELERAHRTAWLALFDARVSRWEGDGGDSTVWLDFADRDKFAGAHTFDVLSRADFLSALSDAIQAVIGVQVAVAVEPRSN